MPIYRVNMNQTWFEQQVMNVLYYETTSELDSSQWQEAADDIRGFWDDFDSTGRLSTDWQYTGITTRRVDSPGLPEFTFTPTSGAYTGIAAAESMPTQIALLVSGQANTTFPRRCRTYIAGLTEGTHVDGFWSAGVVTAALSFVGVDLDEIVVTGDTLERVAVELGDTGSGVHVVEWNRIANYNVTDVPATQRRRRIGVGA